jgi:hypothetical protein
VQELKRKLFWHPDQIFNMLDITNMAVSPRIVFSLRFLYSSPATLALWLLLDFAMTLRLLGNFFNTPDQICAPFCYTTLYKEFFAKKLP